MGRLEVPHRRLGGSRDAVRNRRRPWGNGRSARGIERHGRTRAVPLATTAADDAYVRISDQGLADYEEQYRDEVERPPDLPPDRRLHHPGLQRGRDDRRRARLAAPADPAPRRHPRHHQQHQRRLGRDRQPLRRPAHADDADRRAEHGHLRPRHRQEPRQEGRRPQLRLLPRRDDGLPARRRRRHHARAGRDPAPGRRDRQRRPDRRHLRDLLDRRQRPRRARWRSS